MVLFIYIVEQHPEVGAFEVGVVFRLGLGFGEQEPAAVLVLAVLDAADQDLFVHFVSSEVSLACHDSLQDIRLGLSLPLDLDLDPFHPVLPHRQDVDLDVTTLLRPHRQLLFLFVLHQFCDESGRRREERLLVARRELDDFVLEETELLLHLFLLEFEDFLVIDA